MNLRASRLENLLPRLVIGMAMFGPAWSTAQARPSGEQNRSKPLLAISTICVAWLSGSSASAASRVAGSYLAHAGVSPDVIAAWLGHADASFTMKTYVHARPEDLAAARDALARKIIRE
jgi:integrase